MRWMFLSVVLTAPLTLALTSLAGEEEGRRPIVVAHRGWSWIAPENTMTAFRLAEELGADYFELDVRRSKDGRAVVMHDDSTDRTTGRKGKVSDFTTGEIRGMDAGSWKDPRFAGEPVPLLEEVFDWLKTAKIGVFVEIKDPQTVPEAVRLIAGNDLYDRAVIISFHYDALAEAKKLDPKIRRGYLSGEFPAALLDSLKAGLRPFAIIPNHKGILGPEIGQTHKKKMGFLAYTVDDPERMKMLLDRGADGIITNRPNLAMEIAGKPVPEKFRKGDE